MLTNDPSSPAHSAPAATGAGKTPNPQTLAEALNRLWTRILPEIEKRMAVLEAGCTALSAGTLTSEGREAAHQAAHKLAGILGTFGLPEGTEVARQAEHLLTAAPLDSNTAADLARDVACLRALLAQKS